MPYEMILCEKAGPVTTITLNRPQTLNAINPQMTAELHAALDEAEADADVRAIILTGAGRAFSAGYDILAHASYNAQRAELLAAMQAGGLRAFLDARDGDFLPEPFGPKSSPAAP